MSDRVEEGLRLALEAVAPEADWTEIDPDENLREALDIDSYDFLRMLLKLQEQLGVEVPEADYPRLRSLADLRAYLAKRLAGEV